MRRLALATAALLGVTAACDDTDPMASQPRAEAFEESAFFEDGRAMRPLVAGTVAQEWRPLIRASQEQREGLLPDGGWVQAVPEPLSRPLLQQGRAHYETWCAVCHGLAGNGESIVARNMQQRRPPALFVPHDHGTQVVYGVEEDEAPYGGRGNGEVRVDDLGAVRRTPARTDGGTPRTGTPVTYSEAAVEHARDVALAEPQGVSMEGLLRERPTTGDLPHPPGFYYAVISRGFGVMPSYAEQLPPRERWAIVAYLRALARSQNAPLSTAPPEIQDRLRQEVPR